jgi:hypothetical protein
MRVGSELCTHFLAEERCAEEEPAAVGFAGYAVQSLAFWAIQQRCESDIRCLKADKLHLD